MMTKLALVAADNTAFPSPESADLVQPPAATPGPIIVDGRARVDSRMPDQMTPAQRAAYRRIFTLIRGNQFAAAAAALNTMPSNGLLTGTGWAELWLAAGSPGASAGALSGWLSTNIALPQAERKSTRLNSRH